MKQYRYRRYQYNPGVTYRGTYGTWFVAPSNSMSQCYVKQGPSSSVRDRDWA